MSEQIGPDEAAGALADIRGRQQQVIDVATVPPWYWWTVAVMMVGLAAVVDTHHAVAIGIATAMFCVVTVIMSGWVMVGRGDLSHPATPATLVAAVGMVTGGPILMRILRRIMRDNSAGGLG
jgi:hypothetical protein